MASSLPIFELSAELSLALAGFSGIAATFGGRGREFSPIDRGRLDAIFLFCLRCGGAGIDTMRSLGLGSAFGQIRVA